METIALHAFIANNRATLISRARARVKTRRAPLATAPELEHGIPLFLTQLAALLQQLMTRDEEASARTLMEKAASDHGRDLFASGLTVAQVVNDYSDVCRVVTELAAERNVAISSAEFQAFNRCVDEAMAQAVTEFARVRDRSIAEEGTARLGLLAHEMRNLLSTAMLSFDMIKRGMAPIDGSMGAMHTRSLLRLNDLVDRSLTRVRLEADLLKRERVVVAELLEEAELAAALHARDQNLSFSVSPVARELVVEIDRQILAGALMKLLHNAFKFTRPSGLVTMNTQATSQRVLIEVQDQCGGLPPGELEKIFQPLEQPSQSRSGTGLGLSIARRAVEANGGALRAFDLPQVGCRFTIDLPRA